MPAARLERLQLQRTLSWGFDCLIYRFQITAFMRYNRQYNLCAKRTMIGRLQSAA